MGESPRHIDPTGDHCLARKREASEQDSWQPVHAADDASRVPYDSLPLEQIREIVRGCIEAGETNSVGGASCGVTNEEVAPLLGVRDPTWGAFDTGHGSPEHVWTTLSDGTIVDPTITQFSDSVGDWPGEPDIAIVPPGHPFADHYKPGQEGADSSWHTADFAGADPYPGETPQAVNDASQDEWMQTPVAPADAVEHYSWALNGNALNIQESTDDPLTLFQQMDHHDFTRPYAYGSLELTGNWDAVWRVDFSNMALHMVEKDLKAACKDETWNFVALTGQDGMPFDGESVKTAGETPNQKARRIEALGPNPEYNEDADSRMLANGYRSMQHGQAGVNWVGKAMMNCWQDRDISQPHYAESGYEHHAIYDQQGYPVAAFTGQPKLKYDDASGQYVRQGMQYGDLLGERNKVIPLDHPISGAFQSFLEQQPDGTRGEQLEWHEGTPTRHVWETNPTGLTKIAQGIGFDSSGDLNWHIDPNQYGDMGAYDNAADNSGPPKRPDAPDESDSTGPLTCSECGKECANKFQWMDHIQHAHGANPKNPVGIRDLLPTAADVDWDRRQQDYVQSSIKTALTPMVGEQPAPAVMLYRGIKLRDCNEYDAEEAASDPAHADALVETALQGAQTWIGNEPGAGIHWTTNLRTAKDFAGSPGIVLIAQVDPAYVIQQQDHDESRLWSDWGVLPTDGNRESEQTIRPGSPLIVKRALVMGRQPDDSEYGWGKQQVMAMVNLPEPRQVTAAKPARVSKPIPGLYDIAQDRIYIGQPGERHADIQTGRITPDVCELLLDPKGNLQIRTQSTMPYSTAHLIQLWYAMHPEYPISGVYLLSGDERVKLASASDKTVQPFQNDAVYDTFLALHNDATIQASLHDPSDLEIDIDLEDALPILREAGLRVSSDEERLIVESSDQSCSIAMMREAHYTFQEPKVNLASGEVSGDTADLDAGLIRTAGMNGELPSGFHIVQSTEPQQVMVESQPDPDDPTAYDDFVPGEMYPQTVDSPTFTAYSYEKKIGYLFVKEEDGALVPGQVWVDPAWRRRGVAEALWDEAKKTYHNLQHSRALTDDGEAWSRYIGSADPIETLYTAALTGFDVDPSIKLGSMAEIDDAHFGLILASIMEAPHPSKAIRFAFDHNLFDRHIPELARMKGFDQRNRYHGETLENHTLSHLSVTERLTSDPLVRMAALFHDIGKPDSIWIAPDNYAHYYAAKDGQGQDHDQVGGHLTRMVMARLGFDEQDTDWVAHLVDSHMFAAFDSVKSARKFLRTYGEDYADALLIMRQGDQASKPRTASTCNVPRMRELVKQARIEVAEHDLQNLQGHFRHANILDPIHQGLPPQVFDDPESPEPQVKPEVNEWIHTTIHSVLAKQGWSDSEQWVKLVLTGSLTTLQYSDDSDLDVSLFVDWDNTEEDRATLVRIVVDHLDGQRFADVPFPLQCFVVNPGTKAEDLFKPGLRSAYDLETDTWINPPEPDRAHDVYQEWPSMIQTAQLTADKLRLLLEYEPDTAKDFWDEIHQDRRNDQIAGKGDYAISNIVFKWILHEGMANEIERVTGEHIAGFRRTASWADVAAKAQRLIQTGRVHIIHNQPRYVSGIVRGDHGTYNCEISRDDPSSNARTQWMCECKWHDFAFDRTRQWKKYEGRPCSHVTALQWLGRSTPWDQGTYEPGMKAPGQRMRPMDQAEQETRYKNYDEDLLDHITEPQADEGDLPRTFTPQSDPNQPLTQDSEPIAQPTEQQEFNQTTQGQPVPDQLSLFQQPQENPFLPSMNNPDVRQRQQDQLRKRRQKSQPPQRETLNLWDVEGPSGFYTSGLNGDLPDGLEFKTVSDEGELNNGRSYVHQEIQAWVGSQEIGVLVIEPIGDRWKIIDVYVAEQFQRRGVASALMDYARTHYGPVDHNHDEITGEGEAWASHVGGLNGELPEGLQVRWYDDPDGSEAGVEALVDGADVGYMDLIRQDGAWVIENMAVDEAWRRRGINTAMYEFATRELGETIQHGGLSADGEAWSQHVGSIQVHLSGEWDWLTDLTDDLQQPKGEGSEFEQWLRAEGYPNATPVIQLVKPAFLEQRMGKIPMPGVEPQGYTSEGVECYRWQDLGFNPATGQRENAGDSPNGAPERRSQFSEMSAGRQGVVTDYDPESRKVFIQIPLHESGKLMPAHVEGWVSESDVIGVPGAMSPFRLPRR